jgi:outer membrane lipoprotein-sorting protein
MRRLVPALLLVCGCVPARVERPYAPPTANELLAALRARRDQLRTLRAEARADEMGGSSERVKVTVNLMLEREGKLRIEAESPLGGAVATLVSDGEHFALLDARQNRFMVGPARACNVARLVRVELEPAEVVDALMGGAPLDGEPTGVSWDATQGGREVLELRAADGGTEKVLLGNGRAWDVLGAERRDRAGKVLWRLTHEGFEPHAGVRLPGRTLVEEPPHHADVRIRYRSLEPNVAPRPGVFQLEPPSGVKVELSVCQ